MLIFCLEGKKTYVPFFHVERIAHLSSKFSLIRYPSQQGSIIVRCVAYDLRL